MQKYGRIQTAVIDETLFWEDENHIFKWAWPAVVSPVLLKRQENNPPAEIQTLLLLAAETHETSEQLGVRWSTDMRGFLTLRILHLHWNRWSRSGSEQNGRKGERTEKNQSKSRKSLDIWSVVNYPWLNCADVGPQWKQLCLTSPARLNEAKSPKQLNTVFRFLSV